VTRGKDFTFVTFVIQQLNNRFYLKDIGALFFFLGVKVIPTKAGLFLSQHKYFHDLLSNTNIDGVKDVYTPLSISQSP
jgi:hypothetical protein